jgi:hypothetical protein
MPCCVHVSQYTQSSTPSPPRPSAIAHSVPHTTPRTHPSGHLIVGSPQYVHTMSIAIPSALHTLLVLTSATAARGHTSQHTPKHTQQTSSGLHASSWVPGLPVSVHTANTLFIMHTNTLQSACSHRFHSLQCQWPPLAKDPSLGAPLAFP